MYGVQKLKTFIYKYFGKIANTVLHFFQKKKNANVSLFSANVLFFIILARFKILPWWVKKGIKKTGFFTYNYLKRGNFALLHY